MKTNQANSIKSVSLLLLCCLFTSWLFTLPFPELKPPQKYLSYENVLSFDKAKDRQLKSNDQGVTPTAARFNAVPELSSSSHSAKLLIFFDLKNCTFYHTRLFYSGLRFINSCIFLLSSDFPILFRKLRI